MTKRELIEQLQKNGGDLDGEVEICFPGPEQGVHHDYLVGAVTVVAGTYPEWTILIAGEFTSGGGL